MITARKKTRKGQAMLVLVLITMISALAIGTSVVVRSIVSSKGTSFFSQNELAFNAADSGVELALKDVRTKIEQGQDPSTAGTTGQFGVSNYNYTVEKLGGSNSPLTIPNISLNQNQIEVYMLTDTANGRVSKADVTWGNKAKNEVALEVNLLRDQGNSNYLLTQNTYKCPPSYIFPGADNLISDNVSFNNTDKTCTVSLTVDQFALMQAVPRFNNVTTLKVTLTPTTNRNVPVQGYLVKSNGSAGASQRSITVLYQIPSLARVFNNTLYTKEVVTTP